MSYALRSMFFCRIIFPYDPQGRIYADGRVGAADEADEHDQGEILRRFAAEEMEGAAGEEYRRQRVDAAVDALGNAVVRRWVLVFSRTRSKMTTASFME